MPEYLAPGVYVEEVSSGSKPIEGVSTSTAGFLGQTERGPDYIKLITSWLDFQRWFGGYVFDKSYLPHAIQGFFDNGGKRCFIGRISGDSTHAFVAVDDLVVAAVGRGTWGNNIEFKVMEAKSKVPKYFRVEIRYTDARGDQTLEEYDELSHEPGASDVVKTINSASKLVRLWWADGVDPARPGDGANPLASGTDVAVTAGSFNGDMDENKSGALEPPQDELGRGRGLLAMNTVDEVAIIAAPDEVRNNFGPVTTSVLNACGQLKDRFAIVSALRGANLEALRPPEDSTFGAFYYPWIEIYDPQVDKMRLMPASGHVAGIYARTDVERGVHKAPANEVIRGAGNLEKPVPKGDQDLLNPRGVNCARDFRPDGRGIRMWGARTMSSDPEWRYINVRRLFLFIEESIDEGTQWVVFEPNHEPTWEAVVRNISNFLNRLWKNGALAGTTPAEAFFVRCDLTTMTLDDIDNGRLICRIGVAPVKPAEFVIFRISQKTREAS